MNELLVRFRVLAEDLAFLDQVDFNVQVVNRHVVSEVAVEPVSFLDEKDFDRGRLLQEMHHVPEGGTSGLPSCLYVHELLSNLKSVLLRVLTEEFMLRIKRETFFFLLLTGHAGVGDRFHR